MLIFQPPPTAKAEATKGKVAQRKDKGRYHVVDTLNKDKEQTSITALQKRFFVLVGNLNEYTNLFMVKQTKHILVHLDSLILVA